MFNHRNTLDYRTCISIDKIDRNDYATIVAATGAAGNWSSGSAWIGGVAPTAADDAQITVSTTSITIDTALCRSADFTGCTGTVTFGSTGILTIGDSTAGLSNQALKIPSGMTFAPNATSQINFVSTNTTQQTIAISSTYTMGNVTVNGVGANYAFTTAFTTATTSTVNLSAGILHTDGASDNSALTHSWGKFQSNTTTTRTLNMGNSSITMNGGSNSVWTINGITGLTISTNTATINFTGSAQMNITPINYNGTSLIFTGAGNPIIGSSTFANITRTGSAAKTDGVQFGTTVVTGILTLNSNSAINRLFVSSGIVGTSRTITAGTLVCSGVIDFMDITGAGTATWTTGASGATYFGDCGGNSGITMTTPATQTATGTSSFAWSTHGWTSRVPLPQDPVVISNSFTASQTVTADMPRLGAGITFSCTGTPTWTNSVVQSIFGSLDISGIGVTSGTNQLTFGGRGSFTITNNSKIFTQGLTFACPTGTYTLVDNLSCSRSAAGAITLSSGTFVDAGKTVGLTGVSSSFTMTGGILTQTGTWNLGNTAAATIWSNTGGTINGTSGTIVLTTASTNTRTFAGGTNQNYGNLTYVITASSGMLAITGSNNYNGILFYDLG